MIVDFPKKTWFMLIYDNLLIYTWAFFPKPVMIMNGTCNIMKGSLALFKIIEKRIIVKEEYIKAFIRKMFIFYVQRRDF